MQNECRTIHNVEWSEIPVGMEWLSVDWVRVTGLVLMAEPIQEGWQAQQMILAIPIPINSVLVDSRPEYLK